MTEAAAPRCGRLFECLRVCRRLLWKFLLWFVIASAVIVSLGRLLAPYADHARPLVEGLLSQALNQPVQIGRIDAQWPRLSPQIQLNDLSVGTPENAMLQVDRARLELRLYNLVRPAHNSFELIALGLNLGLIEDDQGRWSWQIEDGGEIRDGWQRGLSVGDLKLRSSVVRIVPYGFNPLIWDVPEADLNRLGERLRIRFTAFEQFEALDLDSEPADSFSSSAAAPLDVLVELRLTDQGPQSLRAYLQNERSRLPALLARQFDQQTNRLFDLASIEQLRTATKIWLDWIASEPFRMHAQLEISALSETAVTGIRMDGYWQPGDWGLQINTEPGQESQSFIQDLVISKRDDRIGLALKHIDLDALHTMLSDLLRDIAFWPGQLAGQVHDVEVGWLPDFSPFLLEGRINDFAVAVGQQSFGLSGLDLELGLSGDRYRLIAAGQPELDWTFLYDRAVPIDRFETVLEISMDGVEIPILKLENEVVQLSAEGRMLWPDENMPFAGPFLDLTIDATELSSNQLNRWLPRRGIPPLTRRWLDRALVSLDSGRALTTLHGWPVGWEQYTPPGAVHSVIDIQGLDLQYGQDWPRGENLDGRLEFESESMFASLVSGSVADTPLRAPVINIPRMRAAEIELILESVDATAEQLLGLIQALPLDRAQQALTLMRWQGEAAASARVWLPVRQIRDWRLSGEIDLNGVDFALEPGFEVDRITAKVPYNRDRIGPAVLNGIVDETPVQLAFESQISPEFELSLESSVSGSALLPLNWRQTWPATFNKLSERLQGQSLWRLDIGRAETAFEEQGEPNLMLRLSSDLVGTALSFPAPLMKSAETAWPFEFQLQFDDLMRPFTFQVADVVDGQMQIEPDFWQLGLAFGGESSKLSMAENFFITGQVDELELTDWMDLIGQLSEEFGGIAEATQGMNDSISGWLALEVDEWWLGDTRLGNIELALAREENFWRLNFAGDEMMGNIRTPAAFSSLPVAVARFDYLHWPVSDEETLPAEPLMVDPRGLPELQLMIEDFRWGDLELGQVRVVSHAQQNGLEIEQFSLGQDDLELAGSGRWVYAPEDPTHPFRTEARMRLTDGDLGTSLNQAGFKLALERGRAVIELDGHWPGSPLDFGLSRLNGDLDLLIDDGVIAEAQPGAGRLLGLVSLASIPRRLRLDFSDVFGSGLGFDRVAGHFDLEDGVARTENLSIIAPAADIQIQGETNLAERVYNQTMRVRPGLGSTLPIIGALTGGPIGAAAGLALEQLLNEPISGLSEIEYRVTGSWEDPLIETIGAQAAPLVEAEVTPESDSNLPESG